MEGKDQLRRSSKIGNQSFLILNGNTLFLDVNGHSDLYPFSRNLENQILDYSFTEPTRQIRVFTKDGVLITTTIQLDSNKHKKPKEEIYETHLECISASFNSKELLVITSESKPILFNSQMEPNEFPEITKQVRFCLLTSQLIVLADSSIVFVHKKGSEDGWIKHKYRDYFIKSLIPVNRQHEFGLATTANTRICHYSRPQSIFREWAKNTVSLIQCPSQRHFYAHLDSEGILRIGANKEDFTLQEVNVSAICWEMGVLWAKNDDANWHRVVMAYNDQLYDMRTTKLAEMETKPNIKDSGQVINILEALKERPALAPEIMTVLPPIAQNLTNGIIVKEVKRSLDSYIKKSDKVYELLGQIDLALKLVDNDEANDE